ncbi:MAG: right-handed parallel beta-helix repeat-containing protein, partial [Bellilinea sp.]
MFGIIQPAQAAATIYVDDDWIGATPGSDPDGAGPATAFGTDSFATIQEGVIAAAINDTIEVKAGTYTEQVSIDKNLTLLTNESAVINPPKTLKEACNSPLLTNYPIICVQDVVATVQGFTINGANKASPTYPRYFAIAYRNAGGAAINNVISGIRGTAFDNTYTGVGIYVYNSDQNRSLSVDILANTISNFHKNAISLTTHAWPTPLTFLIEGNTIYGTPNATVAQNGIQIEAPLSIGTIQENIISDIAINNSGKPDPLVAVSILCISTPADTLNNVITGAQAGIVYSTDPEDLGNHREISGNQIQVFKPGTVQTPGKNVYGILVTDRSKDILSPVDPPALEMLNAVLTGVPLSVAINNNTVSFVGTLSKTKTFGIEINAGVGTSTDPGDNVLSVDLTGNRIGGPGTGFDAGLLFYQCDPADPPIDGVTVCGSGYLDTSSVVSNDINGNNYGVIAAGPIAQSKLDDFHHNRIAGNGVGVQNDTGLGISLV